jgi:hypothetical protein
MPEPEGETEDNDAAREAQEAREKAAADERAATERAERARLARERVDRERAEKERTEKERAEKELAEQEQAEKERNKAEAQRRARAAAAAQRRAELNSRPKSSSSYVIPFFIPLHLLNAASSESPTVPESNKSKNESSGTSRGSTEGNRECLDIKWVDSSSISIFAGSGPPPEKTRIWHDRSGQFRVEAAFLGFSNGKLRLHKVNGVVVEVPSEKMSAEDMRYVEKLTGRKKPSPAGARNPSDDDEPLAARRKSLQTESQHRTAPAVSQAKKRPQIDWFEFFLSAGCDVDDCTRYASSFEKDKIDESILPDITDGTMRSLGLREGDIIRVSKAIEKRKVENGTDKDARQEQLLRDEELARRLQAEEYTEGSTRKQHTTSPAPNLFAGPGGALKNNTVRRGRPQTGKSVPPNTVDLNAIATASDLIQQTGSPKAASPAAIAPSLSPSSQRPSASLSPSSGFEDDAWTNRPSSTKPTITSSPTSTTRTPSAPPATAPAPEAAPPPPQPSAPASQPQKSGTSLAKTTETDIFDQLSRLSQLKTNQPSPSPMAVSAPPAISTPSPIIVSGSGITQNQGPQMGFIPQPPQLSSGPRGPFAPVPGNQTLLQPLIPTNTGFNAFIPTRLANTTSPFPNQPAPPPFLGQGTAAFINQPILPQPTAVPFAGLIPGASLQGNGFGSVQARKFYIIVLDRRL